MRLAGAPTWRAAAQQLRLDERVGLQTADVVSRRVPDPDLYWSNIHEALQELLEQARDYQLARDRLAHLHTVPAPFWRTLTFEHRWVSTPQRAAHAAAWAWAQTTSSDWRDSPAHRHPSGTASEESRREGFRRFVQEAPHALRADLLHWVDTTHLSQQPGSLAAPGQGA
jgi:hypothetical protein